MNPNPYDHLSPFQKTWAKITIRTFKSKFNSWITIYGLWFALGVFAVILFPDHMIKDDPLTTHYVLVFLNGFFLLLSYVSKVKKEMANRFFMATIIAMISAFHAGINAFVMLAIKQISPPIITLFLITPFIIFAVRDHIIKDQKIE